MSDDAPQNTQIFRKVRYSREHVSDTKHKDYDKPTFLISLERMKIDLYVAEISQILNLYL